MIPRHRPSLAFEAAVPAPWADAYARPVLSSGETLVAVDVVSGRERWRRRVAGAVRSIVGGPGTAWAVCAPPPHAADRHATLEKLSADGSDSVGAPTLDDPVVLDADDETVLPATARELVAIAAADPRTDFWRVDIPVDVRTSGPDTNDRSLMRAAVTVADDGRIHFRNDGRLWCLRG